MNNDNTTFEDSGALATETLQEVYGRLEQRTIELERENAELRDRLAQHARAEAHLHECVRFVQRVLDVVPDLVYVFDMVEQRVVYLTREVKEMIGYSAEEIKGMGDQFFATLIYPDDMPIMHDWQQHLATATDDQIIEYENRARHANGEWHWHYSRARVFTRTDEGVPRQAIITTRDITELKRAEAEIKELNDTLEQRVAERTAEVRQSQALLQGVMDNSPAAIFVKDLDGRFLLFNHHVASLLNHDPRQMIGKTDDEVYPMHLARMFQAHDQHIIATGKPVETEEEAWIDGKHHEYLTIKFPIYNSDGMIYAIGGICTDITERKRAEEERASIHEQIIEAQRSVLSDLSTPLLPLTDTVVAMPLTGMVDSARAQQMMKTLLEGIEQHKARFAIVDITGVSVVDTQVAQAIAQMAQAVRLLGARVVLTGIQPRIAQTMVELGADFGTMVTRSTLQGGVAYALKSKGGLSRKKC